MEQLKPFKEKPLFGALFVLLALFLLALTAFVGAGTWNKIKESKYIGRDEESTITVSDTGEVYVKPDLALASFSVVTEKETVNQAMEANTGKMNAVIDSIKSSGVEEKDLKTTVFNVYPRYEWYEKSIYRPSGERVLVGYEVRQTLEVKIRDMEKIGEIIEKGTAAGANQVGNLQFTVDDQDQYKKQARDKAIEKAKAKAAELASQLGVDLIRIAGFSESGVSPRYSGLEKAVAQEAGSSPQIEIGENKIEVTVTIAYEIN